MLCLRVQAFPFDPNPNWSKFYSDGEEILDYMKGICDRWNLKRDIKFNTRVSGLEWQEEEGQWKVSLKNNGRERDVLADIVISAQGFLK